MIYFLRVLNIYTSKNLMPRKKKQPSIDHLKPDDIYFIKSMNGYEIRIIKLDNTLWFHQNDMIEYHDKGANDPEALELLKQCQTMEHIKLLEQHGIQYHNIPKINDIDENAKFINIKDFQNVYTKLSELDDQNLSLIDTNIPKQNVNQKDNMMIKIDDIIKNLQYNGKDITLLIVDDEYWFNGKEIAEILGYIDTKKTLQYNIKKENKKNHKQLILKLGGKITPEFLKDGFKNNSTNIDSRTIFINEQGLYKLIFKSNKPEAEAFSDWVADVLVKIRKHGSYSIQPQIPQLNFKSFYDDHLISTYEGKNMLYMGFVGTYNDELIFKYGISERVIQRTLVEHNKTFGTFELMHLIESDNNSTIENMFTKELQYRHLYRKIKIGEHHQTELFTITNKYSIEDVIEIMNNLVNNFMLPSLEKSNQLIVYYKDQTQEQQNQIKELKNHVGKMSQEYKYSINQLTQAYETRIEKLEAQMEKLRQDYKEQIKHQNIIINNLSKQK